MINNCTLVNQTHTHMEDNQPPTVCSKQKLDSQTDLKFISKHDCTGTQMTFHRTPKIKTWTLSNLI